MFQKNNLLKPFISLPMSKERYGGTNKGGFAALPGENIGLSVEQTRDMINSGVRVKGFITQLAAGAIQPVNIDLSGTARIMIGFVLHARTNFNNDAITPRAFSLVINNEAMIQQMPFNLCDIKFIDSQFYQFVRPLSGQDAIQLIYDNTGTGAQVVEAAFYYR